MATVRYNAAVTGVRCFINMGFPDRKAIYEEIERDRHSQVLAFLTSDRQDMETQIAPDCVEPFVDLLEQVGVTERV